MLKKICILVTLFVTAFLRDVTGSDDLNLWNDFVLIIMSGKYTPEMVRPHQEQLRNPIHKHAISLIKKVDWNKNNVDIEIIKTDSRLVFVLPLTTNNNDVTYSFTFINEKGEWYLQHIEAILIRLDRIDRLPLSEFPDLEESQKLWINQEIYWSSQIRIFNHLFKEDPESAFNWFKDGAGYFLMAKTWVPFVEPDKAFILYLCWEEKNMKGSCVTLDKLTDEEATVTIVPNYFKLYTRTSHFKDQIKIEHYVRIFQTMWNDRAESAGWNLEMTFEGALGTFQFTKIKDVK